MKWASLYQRVSIHFVVRTQLLALLLLCFTSVEISFAATRSPPKKVAWVIGNAAYPSPDRLNNPVRDADRVAYALRELGFKVRLQSNTNRTNLLEGLGRFQTDAANADIALVYYAGHGLALQAENYLIPVDKNMSNWTGQMLKTQAVPLGQVEATLKTTLTKNLIFVIDACRTPVFRSGELRTLVEPKAKQGVLYLFSTLPGAMARDGTGDSSPFNQSLVKVLTQKNLSLKQQIAQVKSDLDAATAGTQIPWVADGLAGDLNLASAQAFKNRSKTATEEAALQRTRGTQNPEQSQVFWSKYLQEQEQEVQMLVEQIDQPRLTDLKTRAERGDSTAQVALGLLYLRRNPPPEGGNPYIGIPPGTRLYDLARINEGPYTRTVLRNPRLALKYLTEASKKGNPLADTVIGEMYYEGDGVSVDFSKSRMHLEKAASLGHGRARLNLVQLDLRESSTVPPERLLELFNKFTEE